MTGVASFHLTRVRPGRQALALARLGTDRLTARRVPGLRFARLLGTGSGRDTGPGADLRRTALFAVWDDESALQGYLDGGVSRRLGAEESYVVRLRGLGGHGTWAGFDVLGSIEAGSAVEGRPVAVVTRARVRLRHTRRFAEASRAVSAELQRAPGLLAVCGVGEAPVALLGTVSLWRCVADARQFAFGNAIHRAVIHRTRAEGWYGEELFAIFDPSMPEGTWDGRDPLA